MNRSELATVALKLPIMLGILFYVLPSVVMPRPGHIRATGNEDDKDWWLSAGGFRRVFEGDSAPATLLAVQSVLLLVYLGCSRRLVPRDTWWLHWRGLQRVVDSRLYAPLSVWADGLAYACIYAGLRLRMWSYDALGNEFTFHVRAPTQLVQTGPYQWLVHPSYTALLLVLLPMLFLIGFRGRLVWSVIFSACAVILSMRIANEEAVLRDTFGGEFDRHLATRWRLLPGLL